MDTKNNNNEWVDVWTNSFGYVAVAYGSNLYNHKTIEEIERLVANCDWSEKDKKTYIDNCKEVIKMQLARKNAGIIESIKIKNFEMVQRYLKMESRE